MELTFNISRKHAALFALSLTLLLSILLVRGFGGNNPAIVGHSALELIVNGSSVVDNSLTGADIDESTLVIGGSSLDGAVIIVTPGNETTIQNAIDNLSTLGGGTVYMREGTYTIAGPINLTSNIALVGEGSATILQATTNTIDIVTEQNAGLTENVRLKDFAIRPGSATGLDGVVFTNVSGLIEGLDISGMQSSSITVTNAGGPSTAPRTVLIQRNKIAMATGTNGISATGGGNIGDDAGITVDSNIIDGNMSRGILCDHAVITNNEVVGGIGILADRDCLISSNLISSNVGAGISLSGAPSHIIGNVLEVTRTEGILVTAGGAQETVIADNIVRLWSSAPGTHAGIHVTPNSAITAISGNIVNDPATSGEGINVSGETAITGNYVEPEFGFFGIVVETGAIAITGNVIKNGGIFAETVTEATISGNTFTGTTLSDINITSSSSFTVTGNYIRGDLDATSSGTCALTGNVITGILFAGTCSASNNV